jgi:hypothetical protein
MLMICALTRVFVVSEGGLEPVERPLDKRVSDILSAKMGPGGPGCTLLLRIGALQERTKVAPDNDLGTKSEPGMSDPGSLSWGLSSATSLWIQIAEHGSTRRCAGEVLTTPKSGLQCSGHPAPPCFAQSDRSVMKSEPLEPCGGDDEGLGPECRDPDSG